MGVRFGKVPTAIYRPRVRFGIVPTANNRPRLGVRFSRTPTAINRPRVRARVDGGVRRLITEIVGFIVDVLSICKMDQMEWSA